jgi:hypothetical protein
MNTIKNDTEALFDTSKEDDLEVNAEETEYIFMSHNQNGGQNHNLMTANKSFTYMAKFKYFRMTIKYKN